MQTTAKNTESSNTGGSTTSSLISIEKILNLVEQCSCGSAADPLCSLSRGSALTPRQRSCLEKPDLATGVSDKETGLPTISSAMLNACALFKRRSPFPALLAYPLIAHDVTVSVFLT